MRFVQKKVSHFINETKGKKNIYCFGAGIALIRFLHKFHEYRLEDDIKYVVDNSKEKQGTIVPGITKKILIISPEQMFCEITSKDVILITTAYFPEIVELLNKKEKLKNTECYLYNALLAEQYDSDRLNIAVPDKLSIYQDQRIPKTIHYCWFGDRPIPEQYRNWMKSWELYCPNYEIIEWNEKNYDVKKNKYVQQAYEMQKWAFVSDYARIDIIHEYGGIYLDTDVELIKNIDEMLMNNGFCGFESSEYVNYGLGFGSTKHHTIVKAIKEYYDNLCFVLENGTLNQVNCPIIQTEIMKKHGLICNGEFQLVEGMTVYPSKVLCGMSPHSFRIQHNLEDTYAIHHYSGSWVENIQAKNNFISFIKNWMQDDNYFYPDL